MADREMDRLEALGARIRECREAQGLTQQKVANLVRLGRSSIANIESGRQHIGVLLLMDIADVLHVPAAVLLDSEPDVSGLVVEIRARLVGELRKTLDGLAGENTEEADRARDS